MILLVTPARLTRLHHFVVPHALARQGAPWWHASLIGAGVAIREALPIAPATPASTGLSRQAGWRDRPV